MSDRQVLWKDVFDDRYACQVTRVTDYSGLLTVRDMHKKDKEILREEVSLSYAAAFGPDSFDVGTWEDTVANFVETEYAER